jgi:hypothetical protein
MGKKCKTSKCKKVVYEQTYSSYPYGYPYSYGGGCGGYPYPYGGGGCGYPYPYGGGGCGREVVVGGGCGVVRPIAQPIVYQTRPACGPCGY